MEIYGLYFAGLVLFNIVLSYHRHSVNKNSSPKESLALPYGDGKHAATRFQREYFLVYALVVAADWLQVCLVPYKLIFGFELLLIRVLCS